MNSRLSSADQWFLVGFGFAVWLLATIAFRVAGQLLIDPTTPLVTAALFVVAVPAMVLLTVGVFRWRELDSLSRPAGAILLVSPGMVLDAIVLPFFGTVFPNMMGESARYFGVFLLLAYVVVLLVGYLSNNRHSHSNGGPVVPPINRWSFAAFTLCISHAGPNQ